MLFEIMKHIRNFFAVEGAEKYGVFTIEDGIISLPFLFEGQYFLIEGSVFNDGVWKYGERLQDETFRGVITPLAPPLEFLKLVDEIEAWRTANAEELTSPYQSESFGGYTYTKASVTIGSGVSRGYTWKDAFASRLSAWRKI